MFRQKFNFFKKNKYDEVSETPFGGFILKENTLHDEKEALLHCFIKGLLIFTAALGCISGVLSEFAIAYNYPAVLVSLFICSMALSFIHIRKWIFNIGYPLIFILFSAMLLRFRLLVNSGFQALINIINEEYSAHFLLLFTRESTETITNRYLTITYAAIFIGIFLAILINVGIFNDMYFCTVFNLTFWPLQLGIYIGRYPSYLSLALLFFSWFAAYFLKHSGHYYFIYPEKKPKYTHTLPKKAGQLIFHKSNARNMAAISTLAFILALLFSAFAATSIKTSESQASQSGSIKQSADQYVRIFVQNGLSGLFNRYEATGGMSNGRLGGVSSVRPDYQTDLIATFVPYAYETVYLKAFVGMDYTGSSWKTPASSDYQYRTLPAEQTTSNEADTESTANAKAYHNFSAFTEGNTLKAMMNAGAVPPMSAVMMIENVDASPANIYLPYYPPAETEYSAVTGENTIDGALAKGNSVSINYLPYSPAQTDLDKTGRYDFKQYRTAMEEELFSIYTEECYDNYLQIPAEILPQITEYHNEIKTADTLSEQIFNIRNFLTANYTYSMTPGTTPRNEDFVTYFLGTQKEGYCAHFASAATLLFRSFDIPARYVEGYVISQSAVSERAVSTEYDYNDFFEGENILGASNVVEVEINDGDAHAWVEIFVDGFGWVPVEVTPPSDDEEETTYSDFLSALSGLFDPGAVTPGNNNDTNDGNYNDLFSSLHFENSPALFLFLLVALVAILFPFLLALFRILRAYFARQNAYRKGAYDLCISYEYRRFCRILRKKYPTESLVLPEDIARFLASGKFDRLSSFVSLFTKDLKHLQTDTRVKSNAQSLTFDEIITALFALTEKSCFSGKQVSKETADLLIRFFSKGRRYLS